MPKKKTPALDPKEQFKRFKEAAKELEVSDDGKHLERAFKKLRTPSPPSNTPKTST